MSGADWPRSDGASAELAGARGVGSRAVPKVLLKKTEITFISGDVVFCATAVSVNEAGLSFLLKFGRFEDS